MLIQAAFVALAATVGAVPPLEVRGTDFVNPSTGYKFQLVGIAYQPGGSAAYDPNSGRDPLSHGDTCLRDAALMQVMGINAIRVYNLDPNISHDECASIFNVAGIYMIIDVNSPPPGESINSLEPGPSYHADYLNHTFAVVEAFSRYPNTLLFFSGNEVINDLPTAKIVPPYLRAVTRDLKNYIKKNIERQIPVGYSAADVRDVLWDTWNYMQCAEAGKPDDMSRADVFALNSYSWCGLEATYETSTFNVLTDRFTKSSIPVFFSEYGCNRPMPRHWNETVAMYGGKMTPVFSGGVVYEWTEEENGYGLVKIEGDTLSIMGDFNRLKAQWSTIDWKSVQSQPASQKKVAPLECKADLIKVKGFNNNFTLPAVPRGAQALIDHGISPKPSGKIIEISDYRVKMVVRDSEGRTMSDLKVVRLKDSEFNRAGRNTAETGSGDDDKNGHRGGKGQEKDDEGAAAMLRPMAPWALALPVVVMLFA